MNAKSTKATSDPSKGTDWAALEALTDEDIEQAIKDDPSAARSLTFEWLTQAEGVMPGRKRPISIRFDEEVLEYFQRAGKGYQSRMNSVLLNYVRFMTRLGRNRLSRRLAQRKADQLERA
jgi:uncharacterized protein (DUF4415 family)